MKKRIFVCVGTRADALKLCPLYLSLKREAWCEAVLVNCGQHLELTDSVLACFGIEAGFSLGIMRRGSDPGMTAELARDGIAQLLRSERPDAVVVQGDTASSLGCAEAAAEAGVCVVHVEAGLRTGDLNDPFPEEGFRIRIGALASLHFAPTARARENLIAEGIDADRIFVVGNTVTDALAGELAHPHGACELVRSLDYTGGIMLITCHRRENLVGEKGMSGAENIFFAAGQLLGRFCGLRAVFPIHKNERVRELFARSGVKHERMLVCEPLDYPSLVYLLARARIVITDSGGICEEAASLGTPAVIARRVTERPEALLTGRAVLAGRSAESIVSAAAELLSAFPPPSSPRTFSCFAFGDGRVSGKITEILKNAL